MVFLLSRLPTARARMASAWKPKAVLRGPPSSPKSGRAAAERDSMRRRAPPLTSAGEAVQFRHARAQRSLGTGVTELSAAGARRGFGLGTIGFIALAPHTRHSLGTCAYRPARSGVQLRSATGAKVHSPLPRT